MSKRLKLSLVGLTLNLVGVVLTGMYLVSPLGKGLLFASICCMLLAATLYFAGSRAQNT